MDVHQGLEGVRKLQSLWLAPHQSIGKNFQSSLGSRAQGSRSSASRVCAVFAYERLVLRSPFNSASSASCKQICCVSKSVPTSFCNGDSYRRELPEPQAGLLSGLSSKPGCLRIGGLHPPRKRSRRVLSELYALHWHQLRYSDLTF